MENNKQSLSLKAFSGELSFSAARHLLTRCTFGAKKAEIDLLAGKPVSFAVNLLLQKGAEPEPPVGYDAKDLEVPLGQTWVNSVHNSDYSTYRMRSLRSWWLGLMMGQNSSLVEKMTLFWHNHLVTEAEVVNHPGFMYLYNHLLRKYALGNIKELVSEMVVNPAMLIYLNGNENKASAPNENFARELFELFSIGKGPQIADGNYTNYTETDIREAAKVLTGWKTSRSKSTVTFDPARHDKTQKTFTEAFGNATIRNGDENEYKQLVEIIFNQKETARNIARKIYRWFVYYQIDETIEQQIIEPLATTLFDNGYEIAPMLAQLLSSEHFFDSGFRGSQIKNPLDFTLGVYRVCEISLSQQEITNYKHWNEIFYSCRNMEMALNTPPDVAGWPQYYKAPSYYRLWVNSSTIPMRTSFTDKLCGSGFKVEDFKYAVDPFLVASNISDPGNVSILIHELSQLLLPVPLSEAQLEQLRQELIPGLPDSTWYYEWKKYESNPSDSAQKGIMGKRLLALLKEMMRMPEFYLA
jgi:hypothetical protein